MMSIASGTIATPAHLPGPPRPATLWLLRRVPRSNNWEAVPHYFDDAHLDWFPVEAAVRDRVVSLVATSARWALALLPAGAEYAGKTSAGFWYRARALEAGRRAA